jgi:hypothetical protein
MGLGRSHSCRTKPGPLSLQQCPASEFARPARGGEGAGPRVHGAAGVPPGDAAPRCVRRWEYDGLLRGGAWQLPYGPRTEAWVHQARRRHRPAAGRARAARPRTVQVPTARRRCTGTGPESPPLVQSAPRRAYEGLAWANELARRGFVVLVHDAYAFGSRRVRWPTCRRRSAARSITTRMPIRVGGASPPTTTGPEHEHVMAKSLFSAGTTWPGMFWTEDRVALDMLCARPDVDPGAYRGRRPLGRRPAHCVPRRTGPAREVRRVRGHDDHVARFRAQQERHAHLDVLCAAPAAGPRLSGDPRGPRAVADARAEHPGRPALHGAEKWSAPSPSSRPCMRASGAPEHFRASWYPGHHQFNRAMQTEAFAWFGRWLA